MADFETNHEDATTLLAQTISEVELETISMLHLRRLGWTYLLRQTIKDRSVGFPCKDEELFIKQELRKTSNKVSQWFQKMGQQNNWPCVDGWIWEIDFVSGQVVPSKQESPGGELKITQDDIECDISAEGIIDIVGDVDLCVIECLVGTRSTWADIIRSQFNSFLNCRFSPDLLSNMVQRLGAADKDVNGWFREMAKERNWPKLENNWAYNIDYNTKQVYLVREPNYFSL